MKTRATASFEGSETNHGDGGFGGGKEGGEVELVAAARGERGEESEGLGGGSWWGDLWRGRALVVETTAAPCACSSSVREEDSDRRGLAGPKLG